VVEQAVELSPIAARPAFDPVLHPHAWPREAMARTSFATRLRPALAQPWIDAYAEFGVIPKSFAVINLVK
jgi:hypothetical protein